MEVILLERIAKLGQMGDTVTVKPGFARNYLLPQGKALRANNSNRQRFEDQRAELEARNEERKTSAEKIRSQLDGEIYMIIRSAGQTGQLYGSVSPRDVAAVVEEAGVKVPRNQVNLSAPIKTIGLHAVMLQLHPEVEATITMNVARSEDEAERQAAGEDLTARDGGFEREVPPIEDEEFDLAEVFENPDDMEGDVATHENEASDGSQEDEDTRS